MPLLLVCIIKIFFFIGTKSTDYPVNEDFLKLGKREYVSNASESETHSGKVGDLFFVNISDANIDSTASTPVNNGRS